MIFFNQLLKVTPCGDTCYIIMGMIVSTMFILQSNEQC